jgi:hypothetical protein
MIKILNISIHVLLVSCTDGGSDQGGLFLKRRLMRSDAMKPGEIRFDSADKDVHHINDIWLDLLGVEPIRRAVSARSSNSRGNPAATVTRRRSMSCSTLGYGVTTVRPLAGTTPAPVCHAACCIKNPGSDIADQHKIFGCQREPGTPSVVSPSVLKSSWVNQEEELLSGRIHECKDLTRTNVHF